MGAGTQSKLWSSITAGHLSSPTDFTFATCVSEPILHVGRSDSTQWPGLAASTLTLEPYRQPIETVFMAGGVAHL